MDLIIELSANVRSRWLQTNRFQTRFLQSAMTGCPLKWTCRRLFEGARIIIRLIENMTMTSWRRRWSCLFYTHVSGCVFNSQL